MLGDGLGSSIRRHLLDSFHATTAQDAAIREHESSSKWRGHSAQAALDRLWIVRCLTASNVKRAPIGGLLKNPLR